MILLIYPYFSRAEQQNFIFFQKSPPLGRGEELKALDNVTCEPERDQNHCISPSWIVPGAPRVRHTLYCVIWGGCQIKIIARVNQSYCARRRAKRKRSHSHFRAEKQAAVGCTNAQSESRGGARTPMTVPSICCAAGTESLLRE